MLIHFSDVFMHDFTSCMHVPIKIRYVNSLGLLQDLGTSNYNVFQHEDRGLVATFFVSLLRLLSFKATCKIEKEGANFMTSSSSGYVSNLLKIERSTNPEGNKRGIINVLALSWSSFLT